MYLKKLEILGFKSFLNKTLLQFEPGVTAVVGPNGCGKSNIFDSMRWVLGEQSVKALRGSDMQDVIFNGTDSKEPLSMAEVSLTFDNSNKFFNVDNPEVAVTRRIFRSGESEYLLNKAQVRLKDIMDLFMGTGIGAESYSLVAQGKIDLVLSSRPEDRRMVFDEASGITKYKTQKREAMRKLEETEQNLLRVNDIIAEVKRQIGSLERQANKARRYKEVFEELKIREINLAVLQKRALLQHKNEIISALRGLESKETALLEVIKGQESKISNQRVELQKLEDGIMAIKTELLNLDNSLLRNNERIALNNDRVKELKEDEQHFQLQIEQLKNKVLMDEEKLNSLRQEYSGIKNDIDSKSASVKESEQRLNSLSASIKASLESITKAKKGVLEFAARISNAKNEISELTSKQQIQLARKKRLELEKAKVSEERNTTDEKLKVLTHEVKNLSDIAQKLNLNITDNKNALTQETQKLAGINLKIEDLQRQKLSLQSHKEFIEKLKIKYEDISESLNAVIYLDKLPQERISGLVVKIKGREINSLKLLGEAKPLDLDTQNIDERLSRAEQELGLAMNSKTEKEKGIEELNALINQAEQELRQNDITMANKKSQQQSILEEFNRAREEEEVITLELSEADKEILLLGQRINAAETASAQLDKEHKGLEDLIANEQNNISLNTALKEQALVAITQTKTELGALTRKMSSDEATLKILDDTCQRDKNSLADLEKNIAQGRQKNESLIRENDELRAKIDEAIKLNAQQKYLLQEKELEYKQISEGTSDVTVGIDSCRKELDGLKNKLHELQLQNKEADFKFLGLKDRISQAYKVDLEDIENSLQNIDEKTLAQEINSLKEKLESYGTVNLVAIEEYDELKKRYDFLTQQQSDLTTAKGTLHEAILKINRTTKKMFLDTFELVREEFRNYFRMLFNGGDAKVFLIDEEDPLESGIEIICRPPGKKLQNVLLLSGGEKSLSAIALIFAIFKVKPSPFCVLDEIDAALDEANVDRFSRLLQDFAKNSQFIVITHNKRTIANADVMYGITMEESGVSKIVSVKFAQNKALQDKEPDMAMA